MMWSKAPTTFCCMQLWSRPTWTFPAEVKQDALPSCSALKVEMCPFCGLFSTIFFTVVCFFLVILLFKMALQYNTGVLSSAPKYQKAVMCLIGKIQVLGKLCLDMSYSAIVYKFNVIEPTIYIINMVSLNRNNKQGYILICWQKSCDERFMET